MTEPDQVDFQRELLRHAERQTRAQESIVNILWVFNGLAVLGVALALVAGG